MRQQSLTFRVNPSRTRTPGYPHRREQLRGCSLGTRARRSGRDKQHELVFRRTGVGYRELAGLNPWVNQQITILAVTRPWPLPHRNHSLTATGQSFPGSFQGCRHRDGVDERTGRLHLGGGEVALGRGRTARRLPWATDWKMLECKS